MTVQKQVARTLGLMCAIYARLEDLRLLERYKRDVLTSLGKNEDAH
jgi:hypothetical protein